MKFSRLTALPFSCMSPQWERVSIQIKLCSVIRSLLSRLDNLLNHLLVDED